VRPSHRGRHESDDERNDRKATGHVDGGLRRSTTDLAVIVLALGIVGRDIIPGAGIVGLEGLCDVVMI
jgi:hypothetical protein